MLASRVALVGLMMVAASGRGQRVLRRTASPTQPSLRSQALRTLSPSASPTTAPTSAQRECAFCAAEFERRGGCATLQSGLNAEQYMPDGCHSCGDAAAIRCAAIATLPASTSTSTTSTTSTAEAAGTEGQEGQYIPSADCIDKSFIDPWGYTCRDWVRHRWCSAVAEDGLGPNWEASWGTIGDYSSNGETPLTACCGCGGGGGTAEDAAIQAEWTSTSSSSTSTTSSSTSTSTTEAPDTESPGPGVVYGKGGGVITTQRVLCEAEDARSGEFYPCSFPFMYKDRIHRACTYEDEHRPWCLLNASDPLSPSWGWCDLSSAGGCTVQDGVIPDTNVTETAAASSSDANKTNISIAVAFGIGAAFIVGMVVLFAVSYSRRIRTQAEQAILTATISQKTQSTSHVVNFPLLPNPNAASVPSSHSGRSFRTYDHLRSHAESASTLPSSEIHMTHNQAAMTMGALKATDTQKSDIDELHIDPAAYMMQSSSQRIANSNDYLTTTAEGEVNDVQIDRSGVDCTPNSKTNDGDGHMQHYADDNSNQGNAPTAVQVMSKRPSLRLDIGTQSQSPTTDSIVEDGWRMRIGAEHLMRFEQMLKD